MCDQSGIMSVVTLPLPLPLPLLLPLPLAVTAAACTCFAVIGAGRYVQLGRTALLAACSAGRLDVARWLLTVGSDARSERDNVSCRCRSSSLSLPLYELVLL